MARIDARRDANGMAVGAAVPGVVWSVDAGAAADGGVGLDGSCDGVAFAAGFDGEASFVAVSLSARRAAVSACRAALNGMRSVLVACADRDLVSLAGELAEVRALAGAGLVAVTAEAETRGVVAASQCASTAAWVADAAWHSRREAATIAKSAALLRRPDYTPVAEAVCAGDVDLASAAICAQQYATLAPDLAEAAKPVVLEQLLDVACEHGPVGVRRLKDEILARYGADGVFEDQCERRRRHIELSAGRHTGSGLWHYRLTLDGEGRAVLEAAIGPGSAPKAPATHVASPTVKAIGAMGSGSGPEIGSGAIGSGGEVGGGMGSGGGPGAAARGGLTLTTRDTRPVGRRRGEALIDALRRSVAGTGSGRPPASPKAIVMLTMDYTDLAQQIATYRNRRGAALAAGCRAGGPAADPTQLEAPTAATVLGGHADLPTGTPHGAGVVLGSRATGELISPDTVRRIACDAGIIPAVLGSYGETLNQGRMQRLFTQGQIRALWRRDRHCTFPDCDIPAAWCDAHHLVHWADGGETDLHNAALLCARHHSIVHRDQLRGVVVHTGRRDTGDERPDALVGNRGIAEEQRQCAPGQRRSTAEKRAETAEKRGLNAYSPPGDLRGAEKNSACAGGPGGASQHPPGVAHCRSVNWDLRPGSYQQSRAIPERAA